MSPRRLVPLALVPALLTTALALPSQASQHRPGTLPDGRIDPSYRASGKADPAPIAAYEMPFPCGQSWTGTSRADHSPSPKAIDWNRPGDYGDDVAAAAAGTVTTSEMSHNSGYGNYIVIDHGNDESTLYAHLSERDVVVGQHVDQGTLIGKVGDTGNVTGPHLHFEERLDRTDQTAYFHGAAFVMGTTQVSQNCPVVPLAGNLLGGKIADLVVFQRGATGQFRVQRPGKADRVFKFGTSSDVPILGDWDGNGLANPGVWTPSTRTFKLRVGGAVTSIRFGAAGATPIAGDWDGDGRWEVGVRRANSDIFRIRSASGNVGKVELGTPDDIPVTGDWDGDGGTDLGVYDQATSTFTLREVRDGLVWTAQVQYGDPGDVPVTGDWDGNGTTDLGVWDPHTSTFSQRIATSVETKQFTTRSRVVS